MPGIVKIGMTERDDVQRRMAELYSTGVPLPFECVIARQLEDVDAARVENALHTAFDPSRVNPSREFFKIEPEQVEALLHVMPGWDVTPRVSQQIAELQPEDIEAASAYKRRQARTNEAEFMESLSESGRIIYERVLDLGKQQGMHINWGTKGFSLNVISNGARVVVCYGYPLSAFNQRISTDFEMVVRKTSVPAEAIEALKRDALSTGLFSRSGGYRGDLICETDRKLDASQLDALAAWLESLVRTIREYEDANAATV